MKERVVRLDAEVRVSLPLGPGREWLGIGEVRVGEVKLRDGRTPMVVRLDTPEGILYTRCRFEEIVRLRNGGARVRFTAVGCPWGRREYRDEYEQSMVTPDLPDEVHDTLWLCLAPVRHRLGGRDWTGFSYSFRYRSAKRRVHRLLLSGSWELGGSIVGNTVLSQGQCNMPVYRGTRSTLFTTTCLKTLDQYGSAQGVSYQLAPRGGLIQAFDFQFGRHGALWRYWPDFAAVCSLLESPPGSPRLHVIDEYRFPLAARAVTPPHVVLFTPGRLAEHEARDLWWQAHQCVYGGHRRAYKVSETVVRPEAGLRYSARVRGDRLKMTVGGVEVEAAEVPYAIGDHVLPGLAARGIRRFFPEVMSESDVTEVGMRRKLDGGIHGDLHCASVCATHRFRPAEFWGGMRGWRYMAERARALGIEMGAWFAPHFSPRAAIFRDHPEYRMTGVNSTPMGGGYSFQTIVSADWNTGIYDWVLADIRRWREDGGLDYLFTDSWANLGLLAMNYAASMRTNFERLARLYGDFCRLGIRVHTFEGISPFGASRFGLADLRGARKDAVGGVVGQNDFGWWAGDLDMAFGICMCVDARKRAPRDVHGLMFRVMANRGYIMPDYAFGGDEWPDWCIRLNRVYEQALPQMRTRRLLPDGAGVRWRGEGGDEVLWAYRGATHPVPLGARVLRLTGADAEPVAHDGRLRARALNVYCLAGGDG